jgi:mono/diheme cytochrome c family protein
MAPVWLRRLTPASVAGAVFGFVLLAALVFVLVKMGPAELFPSGDGARPQLALGRSVYDTRCAICHGRNLEGQPNWQRRMSNGRMPAPPHDASGHTWHHPDDVLIGVTRNGLKPYAGDNYESDMPAFAGTLGNEEIEAVIAYIKSTWPKREREYQERITRQKQAQDTSR